MYGQKYDVMMTSSSDDASKRIHVTYTLTCVILECLHDGLPSDKVSLLCLSEKLGRRGRGTGPILSKRPQDPIQNGAKILKLFLIVV